MHTNFEVGDHVVIMYGWNKRGWIVFARFSQKLEKDLKDLDLSVQLVY